MIIDVRAQMANAHIPLKCAYLFADSSTAFAIVGVPSRRADGEVVGVALNLTNADGAPFSLPCVKGKRGAWLTSAAPSCFPSHGFVRNGMNVSATIRMDDGTTLRAILGRGDVDIITVSADIPEGDPTKVFVVKGDDVYLRSEVVEGVQHYVKQEMEHDPEIGWGANWTGDYILDNGEFVPANAEG